MIQAPKLERGGEVRVVAVGEGLARLPRAQLEQAAAALQRLGFAVRLAPHARDAGPLGGPSPQDAAADLNEALADPAVSLVLCAAPGGAAAPLLPLVDYDLARRNPKWLAGGGRAAALLCAVWARAGLPACHGPCFTALAGTQGQVRYTLESLALCCAQGAPYYWRPAPGGEALRVWRQGMAAGRAVAAGLDELNLLQGTPYFPPLEDAVLFVGAPSGSQGRPCWPERLAAGLHSLFQQPGAARVRGLVLGGLEPDGALSPAQLDAILQGLPALRAKPIALIPGPPAPAFCFAVGGTARLELGEEARVCFAGA